MTKKVIRIGCAAGFWGDTETAAPQLIAKGEIDYLVFDYLAEVTMSILARAHAKDAEGGWAKDFVNVVMRQCIKDVVAKKIKVVANAGGVNLKSCRDALSKLADELGVKVRVAIVEGDDLLARAPAYAEAGLRELDGDAKLPKKLWSMNAYLGAAPIAEALARGADIVITGRCVDSAVVLGPLMHEFGWKATDYDLLAAGSLAGHIIECGTQATGGTFTDWETVEGWDTMGFPIVECKADGSFFVTKPPGTGGLVSVTTVAEQLLYEIGDPRAYILPDVICDFSDVRLQQIGPDKVEVTGARGNPPTADYKVSATYQDGFRATSIFTMVGFNAATKIRRMCETIFARTRRIFSEKGMGDYRRAVVRLLGTEDIYGAQANPVLMQSRELVGRMDVHHDDKRALEIWASEIAPSGTGMAPGRLQLVGGRPSVAPMVRLFSCLVPKSDIQMVVDFEGARIDIPAPIPAEPFVALAAPKATAAPKPVAGARKTPLVKLAYGRSGDKGDSANIAIIARKPEYLPIIRAQLTEARVAEWFAHLVDGSVVRYDVPGLNAVNFVLERALDGGGAASLRPDTQGKSYAQLLLAMPIETPADLRID
jgi:hypothetical protein